MIFAKSCLFIHNLLLIWLFFFTPQIFAYPFRYTRNKKNDIIKMPKKNDATFSLRLPLNWWSLAPPDIPDHLNLCCQQNICNVVSFALKKVTFICIVILRESSTVQWMHEREELRHMHRFCRTHTTVTMLKFICTLTQTQTNDDWMMKCYLNCVLIDSCREVNKDGA